MTYPTPYPAPPVLRSAGTAVALEIVIGLFGIFGIGNIYAGRKTVGIILMVSFWVLFWINIALMLIVIGFFTLPITWVIYAAVGALSAARGPGAAPRW